jgi:hypothetical protein
MGALNHLGVEVSSAQEVKDAERRLTDKGLSTHVQESTTCCFALQDKVWTNDPDGVPWETYTVLADVDTDIGLGCSPEGCAAAAMELSGSPGSVALPDACC